MADLLIKRRAVGAAPKLPSRFDARGSTLPQHEQSNPDSLCKRTPLLAWRQELHGSARVSCACFAAIFHGPTGCANT